MWHIEQIFVLADIWKSSVGIHSIFNDNDYDSNPGVPMFIY